MSRSTGKYRGAAVAATAFLLGALLTYTLQQKEQGGEPLVTPSATAKEPLYWVAPMDPSYRRDKPGKSPMGMDLVPVYAEPNETPVPGTVIISPTVANNLGVQVGKVLQEDLSLQVATVGFIQFDEQSINHLHSRVDGWIESLAVISAGDPVTAGQQLFELYSPELVGAQEELVAALNVNNRQLVMAAKRKLLALDVDPSLIEGIVKTRQVKQRLPFYAPSSGYIASLNVREGMFIKPATEILSVGSLAQVWVIAEVFERQAAWIKQGQSVRMRVDSYPGEEWIGRVDYLYPVLNAQTRTLRARIIFDNRDERLKPNMFAQLVIEAGTKAQVLSVPREAVIAQGGIKRVVKVTGEHQYRSVRVLTGIESGERIEITAGLQAGDQVVVSSQFLIDSESSLSAEFDRIEGQAKTDAIPASRHNHHNHHNHH